MFIDPFDPQNNYIRDEDENSNFYILKWCNWKRRDIHILCSTNHSEGAHGNINTT